MDINTNRRAGVVRRAAGRAAFALFFGGTCAVSPLSAQDALQLAPASESSFDATPQTRMRPIGEPSLVDRYRPQSASSSSNGTSARQTEETNRQTNGDVAQANSVRYAARQSDASPFPVRRSVFQAPADQAPNAAPALPEEYSPSGGIGMPGVSPPLPGTSASPDNFAPMESAPLSTIPDSAPVPVPRLDDQMATIDNCNCISAPSTYSAGGSWGCGTETQSPVIYSQPGGYVPPPTFVAPPVVSPAMVPAGYSTLGHRPLFTLGQDVHNAQVGRGIIGQPTAYVPGQNVRNFLRYLTP